MRIVIDLQAWQSAGNRIRGIGRYSKRLALAMLQENRGHDFWIALNGGLGDAVEDVRASFDGLLPQEQIVLWDNPFPGVERQQADPWAVRVAEVLREDFLHSLRPDVVHVASLFEGWNDAIVTSIGRGSAPAPPTAVTLYDLIPLAMSDLYLKDPPTRRWYERKLEDLRRADLCLAISDFTRVQGMQLAGMSPESVVNISGSIDPIFRRIHPGQRQAEALAARYGIWRPFVMYTGGFDPRKNVAGLIRAYAALPADLRERRQLVIVGQPPHDVQAQLLALAAECGLGADEARFVGFVPDDDLVGLYNACELYVFPSRYEGFGLPALEAMACGAAVIGADATSLPEVMGHPEAMFAPDSDLAMRDKMLQGLVDENFRRRLLDHASERTGLFSWQNSARVALDAMEALVASPRLAATRSAATDDELGTVDARRWAAIGRQSAALSELVLGRDLDHDARRRLAAAQSENHAPASRRRQLIVDVSNLVRHDAGTGIQRVVRNILRKLFEIAPADVEVVPVHFDDHGVGRQAREFSARLLGRDAPSAPDPVLDARPGDIFLGLDLSAHIIPGHFETFDRLRRRGVALHFVVYDLVPLHRPDCVDPGSLPLFHRWYEAIGSLADGLCCISRAVADDVLEWCDQARPDRQRPLHIGHFHLGAELDALAPAVVGQDRPPMAFLDAGPTFLMVSTIEPRKGYAQALAAFELHWARGRNVNLAIVGKQGWLMDEFAAGLRAHPEAGRRLHWFEGIDDHGLRALYDGCSALIAASEAEGFGLPIVEAARHGLPVIARDLPVFTEIAGAHAFYFSGHAAEDLSSALEEWLALDERGLAPPSVDMPSLDWEQSARELLGMVLGEAWDYRWQRGERYWFPANDPRLQHQVGRMDRRELVSDGRSGFLVYGPYASLPADAYRLRVFGRWQGDVGQPAWLDVVTSQGRVRAVHLELKVGQCAGDGLLAEVEFSLEGDARDLEVRLWVSGESRLSVSGFELTGGRHPS